jgi:hypothetical protein
MAKILECQICGGFTKVGSDDCVTVTCWECVIDVQQEFDTPTKKRQLTAQGYPKGWRFMKEFVHANGTVYHKGVEQSDLKGAIKATEIVVKPKKSKAQKAQEKADILKRYAELKKSLKKETRKTVVRKIESELKRLQKQI